MDSELNKAYKVVDEIIQEVNLAEEESLCVICLLLEEENARFNSRIIQEVISSLKLWNKISANEIKAKVEKIKKK